MLSPPTLGGAAAGSSPMSRSRGSPSRLALVIALTFAAHQLPLSSSFMAPSLPSLAQRQRRCALANARASSPLFSAVVDEEVAEEAVPTESEKDALLNSALSPPIAPSSQSSSPPPSSSLLGEAGEIAQSIMDEACEVDPVTSGPADPECADDKQYFKTLRKLTRVVFRTAKATATDGEMEGDADGEEVRRVSLCVCVFAARSLSCSLTHASLRSSSSLSS